MEEEILKQKWDDIVCLERIFILRYTNIICGKCNSNKGFKKVNNRRSYQCPNCGFQIYPTADTILHKSRIPLAHWFVLIHMQSITRKGVSAKKIERSLNVSYETALRMSHQVKKIMTNNKINRYGYSKNADRG